MAAEGSLPPGVLEALLPRQNRPKPTLLSSFSAGVQDVCTPDSDLLYNKYDLLCPRLECGSIILRTGVAKLLERPSVRMEPADRTHSLLPSLPEPPANTQWWLITPSPMEFENIGFSKPVDPLSSNGTYASFCWKLRLFMSLEKASS